MTFRQIILAVIVAFLWAICFPLIEVGHLSAPPLMFAASRSLLASFSIILPLLLFDRSSILSKANWRASIPIGLTYTVLGFGGMFLADGRVAPGLATLLANTQPFIAAGIAFFVISERLEMKGRVGLTLGFLGILLIAAPQLFEESLAQSAAGIAFILLGAIGTGSGNVLMKKASAHYDILALTGLQLAVGAAVLFVLSSVFEGHRITRWNTSFVWALIVLAVPGTSLATIIWLYLLEKIQLTKLNIFTFLTPAFGLLIGFAFFNDRYSFVELIGAVLIMLGLSLASGNSAKNTRGTG